MNLFRSTNFALKTFIRTRCIVDEINSIKHVEFGRATKQSPVPPAVYGGRYVVTMLPGTGIGPELMEHIRDIFDYARVPVDFEVHDVINSTEDLENAIVSIKRNGCCIKGSIDPFNGSSDYTLVPPDVQLRKSLDLHVCLNIFKSYKNVNAKYANIDILVVRQNTEGEYSMLEHESLPGVIESMKICTRTNSARLAKWALLFSKLNNRKKITIVHKANIHLLSDGLFLKTIKNIARAHPEIEVNDLIIDSLCMQMVENPHKFDVLICPNLYGTVLVNMLCGLTGGAGLTAGCNFGNHLAIFEAASRSKGTLIAGEDIANPIAMINASIAMLQYLGHEKIADIIKEAVRKTVEDDGVKTTDIGGTNKTTEVVQKIKDNLNKVL